MGYRRDMYRLRGGIDVVEYHTLKDRPKWMGRKERRKPTPEEMQKANIREKQRRCRRLILNNFTTGDHWITLTYEKDQRPASMDEAKKDFNRFMERLKRRCKKHGESPKWIRNIEQGSKGGWHVHLLLADIQGMDIRKTVQEIWQLDMGKGRIYDTPTYEEGGFTKLAAYLTKDARDVNGQMLCSYSTSRNLERPVKETRRMRRDQLLKNGSWKSPRIPKGFFLDKDSYEEWINPITGFPCRRYVLLKLPATKRGREPNDRRIHC